MSLTARYETYNKADSNEKSKYWMLRKAVLEHPRLFKVLPFTGSVDY